MRSELSLAHHSWNHPSSPRRGPFCNGIHKMCAHVAQAGFSEWTRFLGIDGVFALAPLFYGVLRDSVAHRETPVHASAVLPRKSLSCR